MVLNLLIFLIGTAHMGTKDKKSGWANAVAHGNSYKTMDIAVKSTGFASNELKYRTLSHSSSTRLGESLLLNSRLHRNDWATESSISSYFTDHSYLTLSMRGKGEDVKNQIQLPAPVELNMELTEVLKRRRSVRQYTGDNMDFNYLATLLKAGSGISGAGKPSMTSGEAVEIKFKTHSSAGGLYPIDLYAVALNVSDLKRNVYRYNAYGNTLVPCGDVHTVEQIIKAFAVSEESISIRRANVIFLFIAQPWRVMRKYGDRGMRFVLMEAGAIAQNIGLATTAMGFGGVECAATYDNEIHEALEFDGVFRAHVHSMIVGCKG